VPLFPPPFFLGGEDKRHWEGRGKKKNENKLAFSHSKKYTGPLRLPLHSKRGRKGVGGGWGKTKSSYLPKGSSALRYLLREKKKKKEKEKTWRVHGDTPPEKL